MSVIQRVVKPTTRKGKKILVKREPQIKEAAKRTLFFQGRKSSEKIRALLKDLFALKKPDGTMLNRKNDITIFENVTPVEQFCRKHDTPLFLMGSHSKKRPDNLVVGRMFDCSLLDMVELSVDSYQGFSDFNVAKVGLGCKPSLVFAGPAWDENPDMKQLKSIFVDLFHREPVECIRLQGLEHALSFTATKEGKVLMRSYKVLLKKSGCRTPRIELEEMGPRVDFTVRRTKLPADDLMKQACRQPKQLKPTKKKNVSVDGLGTTHGRIHLGKQDISRLQTRKMKGLRKTVAERKAEAAEKRNTQRKLAEIDGNDGEKKVAVKRVTVVT